MPKWFYFTILAFDLVRLVVVGWVVMGIRAETKPSGRLAPRPA